MFSPRLGTLPEFSLSHRSRGHPPPVPTTHQHSSPSAAESKRTMAVLIVGYQEGIVGLLRQVYLRCAATDRTNSILPCHLATGYLLSFLPIRPLLFLVPIWPFSVVILQRRKQYLPWPRKREAITTLSAPDDVVWASSPRYNSAIINVKCLFWRRLPSGEASGTPKPSTAGSFNIDDQHAIDAVIKGLGPNRGLLVRSVWCLPYQSMATSCISQKIP